jgi:hypothetical protein
MKKKDHHDELPPLYEVEEMPVERRLNAPDRRAGKKKRLDIDRRRRPGRRATDHRPRARKKS